MSCRWVISVASHTNGDEMHEMFQAIENNDIKKAAAIQRQFIPDKSMLSSLIQVQLQLKQS